MDWSLNWFDVGWINQIIYTIRKDWVGKKSNVDVVIAVQCRSII